jgi:hypothetical protein
MNIVRRLIDCGMRPLRGSYLPLSLNELEGFEKELAPFPTDYREFLLKYGYAVFDKEVKFIPIDSRFAEISPDGWATLDLFYGATYDNDQWDPNSMRANIENMKGRMPTSMIPIASSGNDHVCLGIAGDDRNKVFYWDREDEPTVDYHNVYIIANSFGEFVCSLKCDE